VRTRTPGTWARRGVTAGLVLAITAAPLVLADFQTKLLVFVGISALVVLGLVVLTGVAGLTSFGQAAFMGIGAYATAWVTTAGGGSPWLGLLAGLAVTAAAAALLGALTLRLSGPFLPVGTIAWGIALFYLLGTLPVLGQRNGITGIAGIRLFGMEFVAGTSGYYLVWSVLVLAVLGARNLLNSRTGRAIRALAASGLMAEAFGVDTARLKTVVFIYAALLASLAGWFYAELLRFVNPSPFNMENGLELLFMAVVGGNGSPWAAILGTGLIAFVKQVLQDYAPDFLGNTGSMQAILLGVLLILLLQRLRNGLTPWMTRLLPRSAGLRLDLAATLLPPLIRPTSDAPLLEVRGATKRFGGLVAVNAVSFELRRGEILGLIGPNGAGKSTCFDLVSGVQACTSGEVLHRGKRIDRLGARAIAALGVARTFQHVKLVRGMTALENVAIGATGRGRCGFVASMLGLDGAEERSLLGEARARMEELGLGAHLYDRAGSLPLGKQRVLEIARALCASPELLLLDEPAAGLRETEKDELAAVLARLRDAGLGIILVEHNLDFLMRLADRLVVMQFGSKLASGSPEEVTRSPEVIEAYLGAAA
jgi:ABC-type branched-subunit amino acid transport system ATPase component/ABC-type branched-subunit amino acid transport system permease subunit